ncbi:acyl carrier protein [Oerskovia jenensis]|jgi:acyl carrier protein|uniref:Acyl carrier protein n=1 Tax=Oerskovia jenensis TaxID=162169 RepID=A0ABS2LHC5_9CELL|nr:MULTISPECIES: acyl carrier protein [Oerskovia]MBM7479524.1 acyl carrier protein [Oerskovia jenensis]QDW61556.1 acyl carrier protein [Oerskovia sp. KBS0722]
MTETVFDPSPESIADLVGRAIPGLPDLRPTGATFDDLAIDSLTTAEIAAVVSQAYGIEVSDYDVASLGDLDGLSRLVRDRIAAGGDG